MEVSNYISDFLSHRNLALARVPLELIKEKFIIHGLANTPTTNAKADTFLKEYYSNCRYLSIQYYDLDDSSFLCKSESLFTLRTTRCAINFEERKQWLRGKN